MNSDTAGEHDAVVEAVLASGKYKEMSPDLVGSVAGRELAKGRSRKDAIKATKNKLHQIAGVYLPGGVDYARWLRLLAESMETGDVASLRLACRQIMERHSSTRERLPILERFYSETLGSLGPIHRVVDIASGLNPLAMPWMPLAEGAEYYAYDIYLDMMTFLSDYFALVARGNEYPRVRGHAAVQDVVASVPEQPADVALLLKAIPCLEQIDKSSAARLLRQVPAAHVLVSFPAQSLGGRSRGMLENYEARFFELVAGTNWSVTRFQFATELAFLVSK